MKNSIPFLIILLLLCTCDAKQETKIISRSDALPPLLKKDKLYKYITNTNQWIVIHHSAFFTQPGIKTLYFYHTRKLKYNDIGYHFVILKNGDIHEGRSINYMGAHAGQTKEANEIAGKIRSDKLDIPITEALKLDPDFGAIGICLDGNFNYYAPNRDQLTSLKKLLKYLIDNYHIKIGHIILHQDVKEEMVEPKGLHFLGKETECPGFRAVKKIHSIINSIHY